MRAHSQKAERKEKMQQSFLEELGIEKEIIDKIISASKTELDEARNQAEAKAETLEKQLLEAKETLKAFEGVDVTELRGKITQLSTDLEQKEIEYQAQLADMEFNAVLDKAIASVGAKNAKSVMALLDLDSIKASKNQEADIKNALEQVKKENDYLFTSDEPFKNAVKKTNNPSITELTQEMFSKMGYAERISLKKNDPQKYEELKG